MIWGGEHRHSGHSTWHSDDIVTYMGQIHPRSHHGLRYFILYMKSLNREVSFSFWSGGQLSGPKEKGVLPRRVSSGGRDSALGACLNEAGEGRSWGVTRSSVMGGRKKWVHLVLCLACSSPHYLYHLPAPPLTRFNRHDHLPPDAVLQGVQVLADINEHAGLDGFWFHGAEETEKGELVWWAGPGPCVLGFTGSVGFNR